MGLTSLGLAPEVVRANETVAFTSLLSQVEANKSWAEASFPAEQFHHYASLYGASRLVQGKPEFNRGIDIVVAQGSYARSWLTGRVAAVSEETSCGVMVTVQSGPWRHFYCHLKGRVGVDPNSGKRVLTAANGQVFLREGQVVGVGERLAPIEIDRHSRQAQLHWEVQYEARWIDPAIILDLMYSQQQAIGQATLERVPTRSELPVVRRQSGQISAVVVALRRAIIGQESGNNFRAVNPHSGALGYGQVMPFNVRRWSQEALGYAITPTQFLNSPELQLKIIEFKLAQYWRNALRLSGGDESTAVRMVASHWYSGDPTLYNSQKPQSYRGHRYPTIHAYTLSVLSKYRVERGM
ncbi:MAG: M23 family metallopeptidase [Leptolyngbyaceae cyanobacterium bins.59]|nr:M23 family metallopeptidase [Leptolyngbyaceae cyanobacterium bins.59]